MTPENKDVSGFYDDYTDFQILKSFNERHFRVFEKLNDFGLKSDSVLLEAGCGIGVITTLMDKVIKSGKIVSCDISSKSVEIGKKRLGEGKIFWFAGDFLEIDFPKLKYDFITFFDVFEHIPLENHLEVFKKVHAFMGDHSKLVINIPSPRQLQHIIDNTPERLQIIDQPLPADVFLKNAYAAGLSLDFFETHSIWNEGDYQFMVLSKNTPFEPIPVQNKVPLFKKLRRRLLMR